MGRGHYVFDRRWDRMRLALQNMVEKHLNSQMWRKVPLAAESLQSPSGFSSSQHFHPPSPLSGSSPVSTPPTNCYTATFPQTTGLFSIRDAPLSHTQTALGKAGNGTHKSSRSSKVTEDSSVGSKKRRNNTFYPFSSLFPAIDDHKRNGNSHHAPLQGGGGTVATPARRKELGAGGGGLWSSAESWMSRADGSHNSPHSRDPGVSTPYTSSKDAATAFNHPLPSPSVLLAHSGKTESRKRRSPSSCRGKANKVSRPGELESSFGKGNDGSGILASGPESPRQVKMHH
uniref:Ataxin-7-like protein 1 n=1 Tax=Neogobius melanostomus TaxID=47308 RepID=A0A8C6SEY1_9GOBI